MARCSNFKVRKDLQIRKSCATCGNHGHMKECSVCRQVHYCNSKCQRKHWKIHKLHCVPPLPKNVNVDVRDYEQCEFFDFNFASEKLSRRTTLPALAAGFMDLTMSNFAILGGWNKKSPSTISWIPPASTDHSDVLKFQTRELVANSFTYLAWWRKNFPKVYDKMKLSLLAERAATIYEQLD